MINVGICDDEASMRKALRVPLERKLQLLGQTYRIFEYDSGEALITRPEAKGLDLLFLDIEMKQLSGMDTAKALRKKDIRTLLIFVTAYPDYVFQGYEVHAFHYILKPYEDHKIQNVLEQALTELGKTREQFFVLEQRSGPLRIPVNNILAFSSDRRKVVLIQKDGTRQEFYGKLDDVEKGLPDSFIRCHNRHLINLNHVAALEKGNCLCQELRVPVSRGYQQALEAAFARFLLQQ